MLRLAKVRTNQRTRAKRWIAAALLRTTFVACCASSVILMSRASNWHGGLADVSTRSERTAIHAPAVDSAEMKMVEGGAGTKRRSKPSRRAAIEKFHKLVDDAAIDVASLVRPTDASLMEFHEARTPIILDNYKLVLFANPKSGSTALKQLARRMSGRESDYRSHSWGKDGLPHKWPANGLNYTAHRPLRDVNEIMTSPEWTRATFVRDPKERAASAHRMLRPRFELPSDAIEEARRGALDDANVSVAAMLLPDVVDGGLGPMQVANCCLRRNDVDANWKVLCLDHVRTFDGFLDAIANPRSKFAAPPRGERLPDDKAAGPSSSPGGAGDAFFSPEGLRASPGCFDVHWSPLSHWRMEPKFYDTLDFVGHLETASRDVRRLLDRLDPPGAWERYGASGWGADGTEGAFASTGTVEHAYDGGGGAEGGDLFEWYANEGTEARADEIYRDDYENERLDLTRVPIGEARSFYEAHPFGGAG